MKSLESLLAAWPYLVLAFVLAIALVVVLALMLDAGARLLPEWTGLFFAGVPVSMILGVLILGRVVTSEDYSPLAIDLADVANSSWASRIVTLACLAIAVERLLRFFIRGEFRHSRGNALVLAMLCYVVCVNWLAAVFGSGRYFTHQLVYAPLIVIAVFAYAQTRVDQCIVITRNVLVPFMLLSLVFLAIKPGLVAETRYDAGLLPGFGLRLYGFATHPNTMAPLCLLLMCTLRLRPFGNGLLQFSGWTLAAICLLLTQSKTSVLLGAAALLAFKIFDVVRAAKEDGPHALQTQTLKLVTGLVLAAGVGATLLVLVLLTNTHFIAKIEHLVDRLQLGTLTGRTAIWSATLKAVAENPSFGYGPGLWGAEFRFKTGFFFTHAHNQYIQTLGAAGIVGLCSLLGYLGALLVFAWRTRVASRGVTMVLVMYLLLRGLTEVPMAVSGIIQTEFLVQMFLLVLCVGYLPQRQLARQRWPVERPVSPLARQPA